MEETRNDPGTALVKTEARIELTHDGRGNERTVARAASGKFVKKATVLAQETAKRVSKVMFTPDTAGQTRFEKILESQAEVAESNTEAKNLGQVASFLETCDEVSGQKMIRSKLAKETDQSNAIKIIIVAPIPLQNPEPIKPEDRKAPAKPSFAEVVSIQTNN